MRRQFLFGTVLAAAMAVSVGAQGGSYGSSQSREHGQNVTVSGCLQSASTWASAAGSSTGSTAGTTGTTGSTAGTSGTMASIPAGAEFVLTNAMMGKAKSDNDPSSSTTTPAGSSSQTNPTSGSYGQSSAASANVVFLSTDAKTDDWSKYLNHQVEVKGTLEPSTNPASSMSSGSGSSTGSTAGSTAGSSDSQSNATPSKQSSMGTLRVSSIKELSSTCSAGQR